MKFISALLAVLAINFLLLAGGVGWLYQQGRLDREKAMAIKDILFPPTAEDPASTQPVVDPTTQPVLQLEALLAQKAGRPAGEQVEFIQHTFDAQMAQLDRRHRELADLQRQVDLAQQQLARDRDNLTTQQDALQAEKELATRLAADKGFQDSLSLYTTMQGKQVKAIFMTLDDQTVVNYLRAMQPRTANRILKEFKTPEETQRVQRVLELMRQATPEAAAQLAGEAIKE